LTQFHNNANDLFISYCKLIGYKINRQMFLHEVKNKTKIGIALTRSTSKSTSEFQIGSTKRCQDTKVFKNFNIITAF